jgi:hypothetical protein
MQQRNSGYTEQTLWSPSAEHTNVGAANYYAAAASPLHPDTLMPMKDKEIDSARISMENRSPRDGEPWHLGIVLGGQAKVQRIAVGTPAHKAKLVFESQVKEYMFSVAHQMISKTSLFCEQPGLWKGQISTGDSLVSISGKSVAEVRDKKELANILSQSTAGRRELRSEHAFKMI